MEPWRLAWRDIAQRLPTHGLYRLWQACETDDTHLVQGTTAISDVTELNGACVGGCAIGYAIAMDPLECGREPLAIDTVKDQFGDIIDAIGNVTSNDFVDWFDNSKRGEVLKELLAECELELTRRASDMQPPLEFWEFTHYLANKADAEKKTRTPEIIARIEKENANDRS